MPSYKAGSGAPGVVPAGTYSFEVVHAKNTSSSTGNEMIALTLVVGNGTFVYDHLVFVNQKRCIDKIDSFRAAIGQTVVVGEDYDLDASECMDQTGQVQLGVGTDNKGADRNEVVRYLARDVERKTKTATVAPVKSTQRDPDLDHEPDDIPFRSTIYRDVQKR